MENVATDDVIAESLGVGDLGQDMPKLPFGADGNFKMPSLDEFIKMLEGMDSLSDEEKEQLKQDVLKNSMTGRKMEAGFSDYLVFLTMIVLIASVFALHSEALGEMLKDETKRGLAKQLTENLKKLSEMFVKLSDGEKSQFAKEFKGQFLNQLKNLNEMAQQQKVSQENGEAQKSIPEFGAADAFQEEVDSFLVIGFGMLIMLFVVFFGYKLYLSLTEKERKREEKLKAKQIKKKK
ncbi:hypothetical protein quinque_003706 [Culex quinquefasciatus]